MLGGFFSETLNSENSRVSRFVFLSLVVHQTVAEQIRGEELFIYIYKYKKGTTTPVSHVM